GANKDWKRFALFRCDAFNPSEKDVKLELAVVHSRSTNYQTRVIVPLRLRPGKNEVKIGIDEMLNVNGSAPNLANVVRWYISDTGSRGPTVYFSDIWLEGEDVAARPPSGAPAGPQILLGYRVKGRVGTLEVDLTVTPFVLGAAPGSAPPRATVGS